MPRRKRNTSLSELSSSAGVVDFSNRALEDALRLQSEYRNINRKNRGCSTHMRHPLIVEYDRMRERSQMAVDEGDLRLAEKYDRTAVQLLQDVQKTLDTEQHRMLSFALRMRELDRKTGATNDYDDVSDEKLMEIVGSDVLERFTESGDEDDEGDEGDPPSDAPSDAPHEDDDEDDA